MVSSDEHTTHRIGTGWLVVIAIAAVLGAGVLALVLVTGSTILSFWAFDDHYRTQKADKVEQAFQDNRESFDATADYITQLAQFEPAAIEIAWTSNSVCVMDSGRARTCRDATQTEVDLRAPASVARWQAKDDGRVFFSFNRDDPPNTYLMYDPQERDHKQFAREHGFTWERDLGDGWSIPGSIPDDDDYDDMWVVRGQ
jgi:hypothetical protein